MVEVLKESEIQRHLDVRVFFPPREVGGELHRELLIADGGLQDALVHGFQSGELLLLLLFHTAHERDLPPQVPDVAMPRELMRKPIRLKLRAVHQDDAEFGVRVGGIFVVGLDKEGSNDISAVSFKKNAGNTSPALVCPKAPLIIPPD